MGVDTQTDRCIKVLHSSNKIIPASVLQSALGVCVITEIKGAVMISAMIGRGIMVKRLSKFKWGYPSSIMCFGMGMGLQAGGVRVDHVLVINDERTMQALESNVQVRLGGELSIAVGPRGSDGQAFASLSSGGAVSCFSYSTAKGVFVGGSMEGVFLAQNGFANREFYASNKTVQRSVKNILNGKVSLDGRAITVVRDLHEALYDLENDQLSASGKNGGILPLDEKEFKTEQQKRASFESRRTYFLAESATGAAYDAAACVGQGADKQRAMQKHSSSSTINTHYESCDEDYFDNTDDGSEAFDRIKLQGSNNPFVDECFDQTKPQRQEGQYSPGESRNLFFNDYPDVTSSSRAGPSKPSSRDGKLATGSLAGSTRSQYELDLERMQSISDHDANWFQHRKAKGPSVVFTHDHIVDERAAENEEHYILSARKGTVAVLMDGDIHSGLAPPYSDFCMVFIPVSRKVGRVSKFVIEPFSKNPGFVSAALG